MPVSWIIVADSSNARIFARPRQRGCLQEIADLVNPSGRLKQSDLDTGKPGRSFDEFGKGRHALEPRNGRRTKEAGRLARQISEYLFRHNRDFDGLILICAPRFLGQLRKQLDPSMQEKILGEIKKDVVHMDADTIRNMASGIKGSITGVIVR
jgi:protein required for attachment to host cells